MPPLLKAVATGAAAFAATNIDDIFVLTLFFGQVGRRGLRRWHVVAVAGQYLVIAALVAVWCVAGYYLGGRPVVAGALDRYGHLIVPFVLIGLGVYILVESGTFGLLSPQGE